MKLSSEVMTVFSIPSAQPEAPNAPPNGIFVESGKVLPAVADARKRGIWFDFGNGRIDVEHQFAPV